MENVIIASFDPTVFNGSTLSDFASFRPLKWQALSRDFPRLCTAHLALKVPVVLATAANIRKYKKACEYPKVEAIYYDAFTRQFDAPKTSKVFHKLELFEKILNREPSDAEIRRFFRRLFNIAKAHYRRESAHAHQPKAKQIQVLESSEDESEEPKPEGSTKIQYSVKKIPIAQGDDYSIRSEPLGESDSDYEPWQAIKKSSLVFQSAEETLAKLEASINQELQPIPPPEENKQFAQSEQEIDSTFTFTRTKEPFNLREFYDRPFSFQGGLQNSQYTIEDLLPTFDGLKKSEIKVDFVIPILTKPINYWHPRPQTNGTTGMETWTYVFGCHCPICDTLRRVKSDLNQLDDDSWLMY